MLNHDGNSVCKIKTRLFLLKIVQGLRVGASRVTQARHSRQLSFLGAPEIYVLEGAQPLTSALLQSAARSFANSRYKHEYRRLSFEIALYMCNQFANFAKLITVHTATACNFAQNKFLFRQYFCNYLLLSSWHDILLLIFRKL
jgi:hypothetical protein